MSNQANPSVHRDTETVSHTGQNEIEINQAARVQTRAVTHGMVSMSIPPRGRGNGNGNRRGRGRPRGSGRGRPATLEPIPNFDANNMTEKITRVLMATLPNILREIKESQRKEDEERIGKEIEQLRARLKDEEQKRIANEEMIKKIQDELATFKAGGGGTSRVPGARGCTYKEFIKSKPNEFHGVFDPIKATNWLTEIEVIFAVTNCSEDQKVLFATIMLKGEALHWWNVLKAACGGEVYKEIDWEDFKRRFQEKFYPRSEIRRLEVEFLKLEQGTMTVQEYAAKFIEKCRFATKFIPTEDDKINRFIDCLRVGISGATYLANPKTFLDAVECASTAEKRELRAKRERGENKKRFEVSSEKSKKSRVGYSIRSGGKALAITERKEQFRPCLACKKNHRGECLMAQTTCYNCLGKGHWALECPVNSKVCVSCRQPGHIAINCPKRGDRGSLGPKSGKGGVTGKSSFGPGKMKAQAYHMSIGDAQEDYDVFSGKGALDKGKDKM